VRNRVAIGLLYVCLFAAARSVSAQRTAGHEIGFNADRVYQTSDVDSIGVMNGNLTLAIPLGLKYPISGQLGFQMTLVYNSNIWDFESQSDGFNHWTVARPNLHSNAGAGWRVSLGRLFEPLSNTPFRLEKRVGWVYEGPGGEQHMFLPQLTAADSPDLDPRTTPVQFSRTSRLRLQMPNSATRTIEFPDGEIHTFNFEQGDWRLKRQEDRFGNWLTVAYTVSNGRDTKWTIEDSEGRRHIVEFETSLAPVHANIYKGQVVKRVILGHALTATTTSTHAEYVFAYEVQAVTNGCGSQPTGYNPTAPDTVTTSHIPLLKSVSLTGGRAYTFDYHFTTDTCEQGALKSFTTPAGAKTQYEYQQYFIPGDKCSAIPWYDHPVGVKTKIAADGAQWDYVNGWGQPVDIFDLFVGHPQDRGCGQFPEGKFIAPRNPQRWSRTTILSPPALNGTDVLTRTRTDHYFAVWPLLDESDIEGGPSSDTYARYTSGGAFRAPTVATTIGGITEGNSTAEDADAADPAGRWLTTRTFEHCANNRTGDCETHVASTYKNAHDAPFQVMGGEAVSSVRTVRENDTGCGGACDGVTSYSEFNGIGRAAVTAVSSNVPGTKTITTTTTIPSWTAIALKNTSDWILDLHSKTVQTDGTTSVTEEVCFDPATAFLKSKRTWRGAARGANDLVVFYTPDTKGNVSNERLYGGDAAPLSSADFSCDNYTGAARYMVFHEYSFGVRSRSWHNGFSFNDLKADVEPTGLVKASYDAKGRKTSYEYDVEGRLKAVRPPGAAWTKYDYTFGSNPLSVTARQYGSGDATGSGTPLTEARYYYDLRGRLKQQKVQMPDGWATRKTTYDLLGRKTSASTTEYEANGSFSDSPAAQSTKFDYDSFGRVTKVTEANDKVSSTTAYTGARKSARSVSIATVAEPDGKTFTTTETYDGHGRLLSVEEPSAGNALTTTSYQYDVAGRLKLVDTNGQQRTFTYSSALLESEDHPEADKTTYRYEANGAIYEKRVGPGADPEVRLRFAYDGAQRLLTVKDPKNSVTLKTLTYDTAEAGRLASQKRTNKIDASTTYNVTDSFTYEAATGRLQQKSTAIARGSEAPVVFTHPFEHTQLGAPAKLQYPACATCAGQAPARSIALGYGDGGVLTSIAGVTAPQLGGDDGITYTASGTVHKVQHANASGTQGILETFEPTDDGLARIASIEFAPARSCNLINVPPGDDIVAFGGTGHLTMSVATGANVQWYAGPLGDVTKPAGTGPTLNVPDVRTMHMFWAKVWTTGTGGCEVRTGLVRVLLDSCGLPSFDIVSVPADVVEGTAFELHAPEFEGATYQWYEGTYSKKTLLATTTLPVHPIAGISEEKRYFAEMTNECNVAPVQSSYLVLNPCMKPQQAEISLVYLDGDTVQLSVLPEDGVTYQWYEGATYADLSKPIGTTASIQRTPAGRTYYWVRMTRGCGTAVAVTDSEIVFADPGCVPYFLEQPASVTALMPASGFSASISTKVRIGGAPPYTVKWYTDSEPADDVGEGETLTLTHARVAGENVKSYHVRAHIEFGDNQSRKSEPVTLTFAPTAQRIADRSSAVSVYTNLEPARFFVEMDPPELENQHEYTYKWFATDAEGGNPVVLSNTTASHTTNARSAITFWVEVTGEHTAGGTTWTETTVSPKMHILHYGHCTLPEVGIEQSLTRVCDVTQSPNVTFRALCDWPNVDFQWYAGDAGDTSSPLTADAGKPDQLTVPGNVVRKVWVRATAMCGTTRDSDVAWFSRGECEPVLLPDPRIASVDVPWGGSTTLNIIAVPRGDVSYTWLRGEAHFITEGTGTALPLTNIRSSQRYRVRAKDSDASCDNSEAISQVATVRVSSAPGLTPPAWPAEVWTDKGASATLNATSTGANAYTWYAGEVGDDANAVAGQVSATFITPLLQADTKYWVHVSSATGTALDSPTIPVRVCEAPKLLSIPTTHRTTIAGQQTWFAVNTSGTNITYQWYQGAYGSTATPAGQPVDRLETSPSVTTSYWLRMTSHCGIGGSDKRVVDTYQDANGVTRPLAFTVSVCPNIDEVTAAVPTVISGGSTTLSVDARGGGLIYQWYTGTPGNTSAPVPNGTTAATITTPAITQDKTFWVRVTSGQCSIDSDAVTVSICDGPSVSWTQATKDKVESGQFHIIAININADEQPVTMKFYRGTSGDLTGSTLVHSGSNGHGITSTVTEQYWARVTMGQYGCYADTPTLTVQVCIPKITTQPQPVYLDRAANPSASATLTLATDLDPVTMQWYAGPAGTTTTPLAGQTSKTLVVSPTADTTYWARVTGSCGVTRDSQAATVTVCNPPTINSVSANKTIAAGDDTLVSVSALGTELTYQWYRGARGVTTNPITGSTSAGSMVAPSSTTTYWCRVTSRGMCSIDSAAITVTVCNPPAITAQPVSQKVFSAQPATFSVAATGAGTLTYQWYNGTSGDTSSPVSGATSTSLTVNPPSTASYWVRVTTSVCKVDSATATVTHCTYPQSVSGGERTIGYNESTSLSLNPLSPVYSKSIRWYRGNVGDRSNLVKSGSGTNLTYDTPALTQTTIYWAEFDHEGCTTATEAFTVRVCKPAITSHPAGSTVAPGTPVSLSITTTPLTGQTYQWYTGVSGNTANAVGGAKAATFNVTYQGTMSYWVRVTGSCGLTADSTSATVTFCSAPSISSITGPRTVRSGDSTTLSVSASGGAPLAYQWYIGPSGTTTSPIANATSASISVSPASNTTYWCRVTSQGLCSTDSAATTVSVCNPPAITSQPVSQKIFNGNTATLSVAANSAGATYQWYTGLSSDTSSPISGATAATLSAAPGTTTNYWVRVTTSICTTDSQTAQVSYCTYPPVVNGDERKIGYNESASLTLPPISPVFSKVIRWYRGNVGDRSNLVKSGSGTNLTYDTPALTQTTVYWAEFDHDGCTSATEAFTVRVCKPAITTQPVSKSVAPGTAVALSVGTTPISGQTYQWFTGAAGTTANPLAGATSATLNVTPSSTTSYWVRVSGTCGLVADSTAATVSVCTPPTINSVTQTRYIRSGESTTIAVGASGSNLTHQWYIGASGTTSNPVSGGTSASLTVSPAATTTYWCRITADALCPVNSAAITVDVCNLPVITAQPQSQSIFRNNSTTLTVSATSTRTLTYQWYTGTSGTTSSPISGATSASLTVTPASDTSYWVRVSAGVCTIDSATATVSICTYGSSVTIDDRHDIASGERVTLQFPTMSPVLSRRITWYRGASGDRSTPVTTGNGTSLDYTTPYLTSTQQYWMEFEHEGCITTSNTTTIYVCKPTLTSQPQSATVLSGSSKTLSVTATGSPLTYQWYLGSSGVTTQPVSGATSASLTMSPAATTSYWVRVTGCSVSTDSAAATITVCTAPVVNSLTKSVTTTPGSTGTITASASGGTTLTYQWYRGQSGNTSQPVTGATSATLSFTLQVTEPFWVRVTSACDGSFVNSATVTYSVKPVITSQPDDTGICALGDSATFSVTATGTDVTYTWHLNGTPLAETTPTITIPIAAVPANVYVTAKSGTAQVNSGSASVTVTGKPTITSLTRDSQPNNVYMLDVNVGSADVDRVTYRWYKGPLGDTSNPLGDAGTQRVTVTAPVTYWVRVTYIDTGCYRDKATSF
jgi:YD repeat-containing protein